MRAEAAAVRGQTRQSLRPELSQSSAIVSFLLARLRARVCVRVDENLNGTKFREGFYEKSANV